MKLLESPYERVSSGKKRIEIRLFQDKWDKIKAWDRIKFLKEPDLKESTITEVMELVKYKSFLELINDFGIEYFGHNNGYWVENYLADIYKIYSPEKEKEYWVLWIRIELKRD